MTAPDDPVLLLAESVIEMVAEQRRQNEEQRRQNAAVLAEVRAMAESVRDLPAPVVNVEPPVVNVAAPVVENRMEHRAPQVQDIRIVALPPVRATARKNRDGSTTISEE